MRTTLLAVLLVSSSCSRSEPSKAAASAPAPAPASSPASASAPAAETATPAKRGKDPETARKLIAAGAPVVDVRTAEEYDEGHIANARDIPVDAVADRIADFEQLVGGDKTKPIVVYCASGSRATAAKHTLEAAGFTNVVNGGGYDDLQ